MTEFAQLSGWRAAYDRFGEGIPLVLLHGGSGRRQWFEPMLEFRLVGYEWWLVDLPGHGESSATSGRYSLKDVANNLAEFLQEVVGEPSVMFAHSYAGNVALVLSAEYPELLRGMIVGDAPLSAGVLRAHIEANREMTKRWRALLLRADPAAGGLLTDDDISAVLPLYDRIEVHQLQGVGHGLQLEAPAVVAKAIEPFLVTLRHVSACS